MINPNLSFAVFSVLTAYYLGDCAWRLWRNKPTKYASLFGESLVAFAIILAMLVLKAESALHLAAKVFVIGGFVAATILRLVARHRFVET
jgi:hypothetical protein